MPEELLPVSLTKGYVNRKDYSKTIRDALRDLVPFVQFKNVKNIRERVLLLAKLQTSAYNFTKSNTPP